MPMRHLTVTGSCVASRMRRTHSATSGGSNIRQAPKAPLLHPIARAAHVQVDLGESGGGADARRRREFLRVAAAQLQRDRMLLRIVLEETRGPCSAHERRGHDHFRVQQRVRCEQAVQEPAMPVGPIHHRGDAEPAI